MIAVRMLTVAMRQTPYPPNSCQSPNPPLTRAAIDVAILSTRKRRAALSA